jgi:uncharacterized protein
MTYLNEIIGGTLIGLASALPLLFAGRIAGVSGYASSAARAFSNDGSSEGKTGLLFVIGLLLGGLAWRFFANTNPLVLEAHSQNLFLWLASGFLVGLGSRMGGGCTSGHGVCGMGRLSQRSVVATLVFMSVAIVTVLLMEGVLK